MKNRFFWHHTFGAQHLQKVAQQDFGSVFIWMMLALGLCFCISQLILRLFFSLEWTWFIGHGKGTSSGVLYDIGTNPNKRLIIES